jgi:large subunit ribosomal protein L22
MEVQAVTRYCRISAQKAQEVARVIQGIPAVRGLEILSHFPKKAARLIYKTLLSAVANAENNCNLRRERLLIKEVAVGAGPTLKRYQPKARGSAGPIRKRTSHIRVVLVESSPA